MESAVRVGDVYTLVIGRWYVDVWKIAIGAMTKKCYKESWQISFDTMLVIGEVVKFGRHTACFVYSQRGNGWVCFTDVSHFVKLAP